MYNRILVPTDGSDVAASAGRAAVALAEQFDADVHAVHVVESEPYPVGFGDAIDEMAQRGEEAAETIADQAAEAGVDVTRAVLEDAESVPRAILSYTEEHDVDLVVMGTHGRSGIGRMLLGSVTEMVLRKSPVPVMTVHGETVLDASFDSILVPFDGSSGAESALEHGLDLVQTTGATLHVITIVDHAVMAGGDIDTSMVLTTLKENAEQMLDDVAERATDAGVDVAEPRVIVGSPFREIVDYADEHEIDCIVMGTRGRSGLGRVLLGSVTERVIRHSDVPVIATKADSE